MKLADLYFLPKAFEGDGRVYEYMGVSWFKDQVRRLGRLTGRNAARPNNYFLWDRSADGLHAYEKMTRRNEVMHLVGVLLPLLGLLRGATDGALQVVLWVVLAVNVYPYLLQRYNRIRLLRVLKRRKRLIGQDRPLVHGG
mgnify:CR=1 FL=1